MRRIAEVLAVVGVLALVLALAGCGSGGGVPGGSDYAAGKPAKPPPAPEHVKYTVTPIGADFAVYDLNNSGCVVGHFGYGSECEWGLWQAGAFYPTAMSPHAIADEIGGKMLVVGTVVLPGDPPDLGKAAVFEWDAVEHDMRLIEILSDVRSIPDEISPNTHWIVGRERTEQALELRVWRPRPEGGWEKLSLPWPDPTDPGMARAINDCGEVAGVVKSGTPDPQYVLWEPVGTSYNCRLLSDMSATALGGTDINERGQIAAGDITDDGSRAAVWQDGTHEHLPLPSGKQWVASSAYAINDATPVQVVGWAYAKRPLDDNYACLWEQSATGWQAYSLNDLLADGTPPCYLAGCRFLNDVGQMVGDGTLNGSSATMLLTPVQ